MRNRAWAVMLLLLFSSGLALARGDTDHAEASMQLTGTVDIDASGAVTGYSIDHRRGIDTAVIHLINRAVPNWRFEPLPSGAAAPATPVQLLIVAKQISANQYAMRIQSAHFGNSVANPSAQLMPVSLKPPPYPPQALRELIEGKVYVVLRIDRTGHVSDAMAEQVNVGRMGSAPAMERARKLLADATLLAAKTWTFRPPTTGASAGDPYWLGAIPVAFELTDGTRANYAQWHDYIPGPKLPIPWRSVRGKDEQSDSEALAAGAFSTIGSGRHLLTSLEGE
ncbi:hypothetical protein [Cognatiluteimonas profundi]|uniref:hypothetical protein n=1 Tax=Cognatiluteimonas profundi TaxID=2594501 RepID=UPI00131AC010|nr:hypothetical protein [Lysobacter profundi]